MREIKRAFESDIHLFADYGQAYGLPVVQAELIFHRALRHLPVPDSVRMLKKRRASGFHMIQ